MKSLLELPALPRSFPLWHGLDRLCRQAFIERISRIQTGRIILRSDGEELRFGDPQAPESLRATLTIRQPRAFFRVALGGSVGAGESFVDEDWDCPELSSLMRIFAANREVMESLESGPAAIMRPWQKLLHRLRDNSIRGSRENIHAHYDLGNDFFGLFLDDSRMYSSGVYLSSNSTLEEAQFEKNDRICRKLRIQPGSTVLEIGTGWGGFAVHAAKHYGARVTTTTISQEQFTYARERIRSEGLEDRITLLFKDYRSLEGTFDHLVSIEMIEAVGAAHYDTYFHQCSRLLKPHGSFLLQAILIQDQLFEQALKQVDFIQAHIFPGSNIPSTARIMDSIRGHTDLKLHHHEEFGRHYARTLRDWAERLDQNRAQIRELGYPESLYRLWKFYFAYCEGGFEEGQIGVAQLLFTKPGSRLAPVLVGGES